MQQLVIISGSQIWVSGETIMLFLLSLVIDCIHVNMISLVAVVIPSSKKRLLKNEAAKRYNFNLVVC